MIRDSFTQSLSRLPNPGSNTSRNFKAESGKRKAETLPAPKPGVFRHCPRTGSLVRGVYAASPSVGSRTNELPNSPPRAPSRRFLRSLDQGGAEIIDVRLVTALRLKDVV
jgi:hypothetical protein